MNDSTYHSLREQIEGLLTESRQQTRQAGEWEKVETYWQIGDALTVHIDAISDAKHGQQIVGNLSKDLKLGYTTLYEILRFRRVIDDPKVYARTQISWSHFRALIHLRTPEQIHHYARLANQENWTTRQLKRAIEAEGEFDAASLNVPVSPLRPLFGTPWTYRVKADPFHPDAPTLIDFGFHQLWVPAQLPGFEEATPGDVVCIESGKSGHRAIIHKSHPRLWTYIARVLRVVDGDTLDVVVDLGMGHRAFPRLRLRGIDTAELYTEAGRQARTFVEEALNPCPVVVITTRRTDTYGRYLADVKYLAGASDAEQILDQGEYLNGQLLKQRLASRYLP